MAQLSEWTECERLYIYEMYYPNELDIFRGRIFNRKKSWCEAFLVLKRQCYHKTHTKVLLRIQAGNCSCWRLSGVVTSDSYPMIYCVHTIRFLRSAAGFEELHEIYVKENEFNLGNLPQVKGKTQKFEVFPSTHFQDTIIIICLKSCTAPPHHNKIETTIYSFMINQIFLKLFNKYSPLISRPILLL